MKNLCASRLGFYCKELWFLFSQQFSNCIGLQRKLGMHLFWSAPVGGRLRHVGLQYKNRLKPLSWKLMAVEHYLLLCNLDSRGPGVFQYDTWPLSRPLPLRTAVGEPPICSQNKRRPFSTPESQDNNYNDYYTIRRPNWYSMNSKFSSTIHPKFKWSNKSVWYKLIGAHFWTTLEILTEPVCTFLSASLHNRLTVTLMECDNVHVVRILIAYGTDTCTTLWWPYK